MAVDPFFDEPNLSKKLQSVGMVLRAKHPDADKMLSGLLETADFQSSFTILGSTRGLLQQNRMEHFFKVEETENRFDKMFEIVKKRHGALADMILPIFAHQDKIQEIISRRGYVTNPEHRFFFALLLNVTGKKRILSLIKERFPDAEPIEKILDWTTELAQTKVFGSNIPNALGIEGFDDFDSFILEDMLKGTPDDEIEKNMAAEMGSQNAEDITKRIEKIRKSIVLKALLED